MGAATCTSRSQLNKQIERDTAKAVKMWLQNIPFDPTACEEISFDSKNA